MDYLEKFKTKSLEELVTKYLTKETTGKLSVKKKHWQKEFLKQSMIDFLMKQSGSKNLNNKKI